MTLKYIWRLFSLGCDFHVHFSYPWHAFASHGLPAIAELLVFFLGGDARLRWVCARYSLGQSLTRVKMSWCRNPYGSRYRLPKKSQLGCTFINVNNFFICGPKYATFFSPNVEGVVDDQKLLRFLICWSFPEIFAIKVESGQKLRKILDDFLQSQIFVGGHCKKCANFITPASRDVDETKSREDTNTRPKVIESNTLNFRPNF